MNNFNKTRLFYLWMYESRTLNNITKNDFLI